MFSDPLRIADAINNPKFRAGNKIMLDHGPRRYMSGVFVKLNDDVEYATVQESDGAISSHPVEWMIAA
jgi:hypothetical protein